MTGIRPVLPDGLVVVVKQACETCRMIEPVLAQLAAAAGAPPGPGELTVFTQDDPAFPSAVAAHHDADLSVSWHHDIETQPT